MAEFLAYRIINGYLTYEQVPASLKEKVKQALIDKGREDLVTE